MEVTYNKRALCCRAEMKIAATALCDLKHQCSSPGQMC